MKNAAYALKKKLWDSWGLTLLLVSFILSILLGLLSGGLSVIAEVILDDTSSAGGAMIGLLSVFTSITANIASFGVLAGIIWLIMERVELSRKADALRAQAVTQGLPNGSVQAQKTVTPTAGSPAVIQRNQAHQGFVRNNIGLTVIIASVLLGILSAMAVFVPIIVAASVDGSFTNGSGAGTMAILTVILGFIGIVVSGVAFPAGVVVLIIEEVHKRKRLQAEVSSYTPAPDVTTVADPGTPTTGIPEHQ